MSLTKKILLAVLLILVAALIGFGLYYLFRKTQIITGGGPTGTGTTGELPPSGQRPPGTTEPPVGTLPTQPGGVEAPVSVPGQQPSYYQPTPVSKLSSDTATFTNLNAGNGALRYYNSSDGKFYHILADGSTQLLVDQVFYNVQKVTWARNKDIAVLEYPDQSKIIYDFTQKKQTLTPPKHWTDFTFAADGSQVAALSMALAPENRWLVTTNIDGTGTKLIEPLGNNADKVIMDWSPSQQVVALSKTGAPQGADRREILFVGLNGENFKSTIVEGLDFKSQWSPTGNKLLYNVDSARSDFKPELWVVDSYGDSIGSNRKMLQLNTWADKCTFADDNTLYCAVPRSLPEGAGMAPAIADSIYDDMYKIDLKSGLRTNIATGGDYRVTSINYDQANNKLIFTDGNQSGVFQVNL